MADLYNSVITNVGNSALIQNSVNGSIFKIVKIEFCSRAALDLVNAMTWTNMASANVIYTISSQEVLNEHVRKIQIDSNTVQFRISLGPEVGGTLASGMSIGSLGIYIQRYDSEGVTTDPPVLLTVSSLDTEFVKYAQGQGTTGNLVSFYVNLRLANTEVIENVIIAPTENYSLPTVESEKSPYLNDYFNAYIVNNYDTTGLSAIAFKTNKNSENFSYLLQKNESSARFSMGGFYDVPETDVLNERFAYYTGNKNDGYVFHVKEDRVVCFPEGFESDGLYRNKRIKLSQTVDSINFFEVGTFYLILKNIEEDEVSFEILNADNVFVTSTEVEVPHEAGVVYFWFNPHDGRSYRLTLSGSEEIPSFIMAKFKIDELGNIVFFNVLHPSSFCTNLQFENVNTELKDFEEKMEQSLAADFVHRALKETITDVKTFTGEGLAQWTPAVVVSNNNPTINFNSTNSTGFQAGLTTSANGDNASAVLLSRGEVTLAAWSNQAINNSENKNLSKSEFLKIDANNSKIVSTSANVQKSLINDVISPYTGNVTLSGHYTFANDIYAPHAYTVAVQALWADLAENYESDGDYPPGTLVQFGGKKEITIAMSADEAEAVVSSKPGFLLNSKCEGIVKPVALVGKVPVRVIGKAKKGDFLYFSSVLGVERPGVACASSRIIGEKILGKVLEDKESTDEALVMCVVKLSF